MANNPTVPARTKPGSVAGQRPTTGCVTCSAFHGMRCMVRYAMNEAATAHPTRPLHTQNMFQPAPAVYRRQQHSTNQVGKTSSGPALFQDSGGPRPVHLHANHPRHSPVLVLLQAGFSTRVGPGARRGAVPQWLQWNRLSVNSEYPLVPTNISSGILFYFVVDCGGEPWF